MRILVTGAGGFLGWHTRVRLRATTDHDIVAVDRSNWSSLPRLVANADAVMHIAGINRGTDSEVKNGNVELARDLAAALRNSTRRVDVVFANSIQCANDTAYGHGKRIASEILRDATTNAGGNYADVVLPNLFGEHGRPEYNSFVGTFAWKTVRGETPTVADREVELLHAQRAADTLITSLGTDGPVRPQGEPTSVIGVLATLRQQYQVYQNGEIPSLTDRFSIELFNTLRSALVGDLGFRFKRNTDSRGTLVEAVRTHQTEGQTFVSTTEPGVTRGQHFHLRKIERFLVVSGEAEISLRRVLTRERMTFNVRGDDPFAIDMPTLWAHNIRNTGTSPLTTLFWTNERFDPIDPDTYAEEV